MILTIMSLEKYKIQSIPDLSTSHSSVLHSRSHQSYNHHDAVLYLSVLSSINRNKGTKTDQAKKMINKRLAVTFHTVVVNS